MQLSWLHKILINTEPECLLVIQIITIITTVVYMLLSSTGSPRFTNYLKKGTYDSYPKFQHLSHSCGHTTAIQALGNMAALTTACSILQSRDHILPQFCQKPSLISSKTMPQQTISFNDCGIHFMIDTNTINQSKATFQIAHFKSV